MPHSTDPPQAGQFSAILSSSPLWFLERLGSTRSLPRQNTAGGKEVCEKQHEHERSTNEKYSIPIHRKAPFLAASWHEQTSPVHFPSALRPAVGCSAVRAPLASTTEMPDDEAFAREAHKFRKSLMARARTYIAGVTACTARQWR
jgi:hypothetical protein